SACSQRGKMPRRSLARPARIGILTLTWCQAAPTRRAVSSWSKNWRDSGQRPKITLDSSPRASDTMPMTDTADPPVASPQVIPLSTRIHNPAPPRGLAIANQKGAVAKTTTAINLGPAPPAIGDQVLIIDLDPQGNASTGLGIDRRNRRHSTYDVLMGEASLFDAVLSTAVPRLSIAPSTLDLSGLELEVSQQRDRAFRLRTALVPLRPP